MSGSHSKAHESLRTVLDMVALHNAGGRDLIELYIHPEIEIRTVPGLSPGARYVGRDGLREFYETSRLAGTSLRIEPTEIVATDDETVFFGGPVWVIGSDDQQTHIWAVCRTRDGLISFAAGYLDRGEAWAAATGTD